MNLPDLIPSPVRITAAGDLLVDFADNGKDYLVDEGGPLIRINPSRSVEPVDFAGAAGRKVYDRGNRGHEISFTAARLFTSSEEAFADQFNRTMSLPGKIGVGADLHITLSSYTQTMILRAAVITAAPSGVHFRSDCGIPAAFLSIFQFTLSGGALEGSGFIAGPLVNEDGTAQQNEDGSAVSFEA